MLLLAFHVILLLCEQDTSLLLLYSEKEEGMTKLTLVWTLSHVGQVGRRSFAHPTLDVVIRGTACSLLLLPCHFRLSFLVCRLREVKAAADVSLPFQKCYYTLALSFTVVWLFFLHYIVSLSRFLPRYPRVQEVGPLLCNLLGVLRDFPLILIHPPSHIHTHLAFDELD